MKKLFGGLNLTWPKLIIFAILAGIYTAVMALLPQTNGTSFDTIAVTFEVWVLFGIIIIMNSKSNKDAALKCFVFFLISQPLVYLIQVPFSHLGWKIFVYYKYWFIWTVCCLPMGYIGYYMKENKWWSYLILFPMILLTAYSYATYLSELPFTFPKYLLIVIFCGVMMIIYPIFIFDNKKIKKYGTIISVIIIILTSVLALNSKKVYSTEVLSNSEENPFNDTAKVSLEDTTCGDVSIIYVQSIEDYMIHGDFKKECTTVLTIEDKDGNKQKFDLIVKNNTYDIEKR